MIAAAAQRSHISRRKILLLHRGAFAAAWDRAFSRHNFGTSRLRRDSLNGFDELVERLAKENKARNPHNDQIPGNWSLDALQQHLISRRATPQTTIDAILHCVHERGLAALKESANIERLSRCDAAARAQINRRIAKLKDRSDEDS
jgi:hypothetical protein